jgi:ketosteroid isomerase-like protein
MSQENIEIVRGIYSRGIVDRDPRRFVDEFAVPEIEYIELATDEGHDGDGDSGNGAGSRHGRSEVIRALRRARQPFGEYRHTLNQLFDGGETVVAAVSFQGKRGRGASFEDVEETRVHVWTLRDGKVTRLAHASDLDSALDEAELGVGRPFGRASAG